jgi:hypothetical protein
MPDNSRLKELNARHSLELSQALPLPAYEPLKSEPWLKWPQETAIQYQAFTVYRDMEPRVRSLSRTEYVRRFGPPPETETLTQINRKVNPSGRSSRWSFRFRWRERVEAFDRAMERQRIAEMQKGQLEAYREMGERHAREAVALQAKAVARLQHLNPNELSAAEVRQFIVAAATLERMSRGASLQDMAAATRENTVQGRASVTAQIEYVDDWRGDRERLERLRSQNSRYGNGQGLLPEDVEDAVTPVRLDGSPLRADDRGWLGDQLGEGEVPVSPPPRRPDSGSPGS